MGAAELLQDGLVKPEDRDRFLGRIRSEAARLVELVQDVINLSRLDEGEEFPREDTDMLALARDAASALENEAAARGVTLTVSGTAERVNGVRQLLWEIVWNLADNAVKYSKSGGRANIDVSRTAEGRVAVTVSDDGVGIPREAAGARFRALLPRGQEPLARDRRHRPRPLHSEARRPVPQRRRPPRERAREGHCDNRDILTGSPAVKAGLSRI